MRNLSCFIVFVLSIIANAEYLEDDDTIVIEAIEEIYIPKSRVKRQYFPSNSLFPNLPGWQNNFVSGFQFPGFGQFPSFGFNKLHQIKPDNGGESCYTRNGELGKCAQFRQCYSLLFSTPEDEMNNEGLALTLRDSAGTCPNDSPASYYSNMGFPTWFAINTGSQQKNKICCGSGNKNKVTKPKVSTSRPPLIYPTTATQRTTMSSWPAKLPTAATTKTPSWPQRLPTAATTKVPAWPPRIPTHATTKAPAWPPRIPTHATTKAPSWPPRIPTAATTKAPEAYNCAGFYIIGGSQVQNRAYPFMVSIKDGRSNRHVCGGSLISPRSVLSAAHCVQQLGGQQVANMRVYLGTNDITHTSRCTVVKKVKNIKYHRGFTMQTLHNDIAILTLDSPVQLNSNIQTVPLGTSQVGAGSKVTVAGWGGIRFGGPTVGQLRHVTLDVISNPTCAARYRGTAPAGITQNQLCAGSAGKDSCVGDSGGPLMMNGQQIGIVSFGVNCGTQPGVYTRVANYLSWINKNKS